MFNSKSITMAYHIFYHEFEVLTIRYFAGKVSFYGLSYQGKASIPVASAAVLYIDI